MNSVRTQRRWASQLALVGLLLLSSLSGAVGCAQRTHVIRTSETIQRVEPSPPPPTTERVVREQTTTTEAAPQGVLSTTVHVIGEVIALPFRLVAGLIRLVF